MTATAQAPARTGERVELARYAISTGTRIVYGQRVLGVVQLTDVPADGHGRHFLIESGLTVHAELRALLADYLAEAEHWDAVPATPCCLSTSDEEHTP